MVGIRAREKAHACARIEFGHCVARVRSPGRAIYATKYVKSDVVSDRTSIIKRFCISAFARNLRARVVSHKCSNEHCRRVRPAQWSLIRLALYGGMKLRRSCISGASSDLNNDRMSWYRIVSLRAFRSIAIVVLWRFIRSRSRFREYGAFRECVTTGLETRTSP